MDIYAYGFGGVCIVVYAWSRFNTPATWRSTTTSWQYMLALAGYVSAALALWFVLARVVYTNPQVVSLLAFGSSNAADPDVEGALGKLSGLSAPLLAALFLTTLLPRLPVLAKVDDALQRAFRELGAIPRKARQLSTMLRRASFTVPVADQGEVRRRLDDQGLDAGRLLQSPRGSLEADWVRIVALMAKLEEVVDLSDDAVGDDATSQRQPAARSEFLRHREVEYVAARAAYRQQAAIAAVLLKTRLAGADEQLANELLTEGPDPGMRGLQGSFHDGCRRLLKELTHLVSCGMLQSNFSLAAACRELRNWGFDELAPEPRGISVNDLIGIMMSITLYLFVLFLFIHGGPGRLARIPIFALSIGLSMTAAVASAIYAKRLPIAGADGRNFAVYLVAAGLAAGCWFVIHYIRIMLMTGDDFGAVLQKLLPLSPFATLPFAAAFALSWMTDLRPEHWPLPRRAWRWLEGLGLGGVLAAAAYIAYTYVQVFSRADPATPRPAVYVIVLVQAGLGFLIGVLVPHLYRRATSAATAEGRTDDDAPGALSPGAALAHGAD
jgi:hypothetical protein